MKYVWAQKSVKSELNTEKKLSRVSCFSKIRNSGLYLVHIQIIITFMMSVIKLIFSWYQQKNNGITKKIDSVKEKIFFLCISFSKYWNFWKMIYHVSVSLKTLIRWVLVQLCCLLYIYKYIYISIFLNINNKILSNFSQY